MFVLVLAACGGPQPASEGVRDAAGELLAALDPALDPRLEWAGTVPTTNLRSRDPWATITRGGGVLGGPLALPEAETTILVIASVEEPALPAVIAGEPIAWSGCPPQTAPQDAPRRATIIATFGLDPLALHGLQTHCPKDARALLATIDDRSSAALRAEDVPVPTPRPTPQLESPEDPVRRVDRLDLPAGVRSTLETIPLVPGAWWRYRIRSHFAGVGQLPRWERGEVIYRVAALETADGSAARVTLDEETIWHWPVPGRGRSAYALPRTWRMDAGQVHAIRNSGRRAGEVTTPVEVAGIELFTDHPLARPNSWTVTDRNRAIDTAVASFGGCVEIRGGGFSYGVAQVICPGVGIVALSVRSDRQGHRMLEELELVDFAVPTQ